MSLPVYCFQRETILGSVPVYFRLRKNQDNQSIETVQRMTSLLYSSGLNFQNGNPLGRKVRALETDVETLKKELAALRVSGLSAAASASVAATVAVAGPPGPQGPAGPPGPQGPKGDTGPITYIQMAPAAPAAPPAAFSAVVTMPSVTATVPPPVPVPFSSA